MLQKLLLELVNKYLQLGMVTMYHKAALCLAWALWKAEAVVHIAG